MNIGAVTIIVLMFYVTEYFGQQSVTHRISPPSLEDAYESLFDTSGYPNTGDLPILNRKIFRGTRVTIREHPYIVSIRRQYAHYLTGTLISKKLVLTVAHPLHLYGSPGSVPHHQAHFCSVYNSCGLCISLEGCGSWNEQVIYSLQSSLYIRVPIQELGVVLGENYADRGKKTLTVVLIVVHEDFDPHTLQSDIAILKIFENVTYTTAVKSIGLFPPSHSYLDEHAFVTGWGRCEVTGKELCLPRSSIYYPREILDPMLRSIVFQVSVPNYYCDVYKQVRNSYL